VSLDDLDHARAAATDDPVLKSVLYQLHEVTSRLETLEAKLGDGPTAASSTGRHTHTTRRTGRRNTHASGWQPTHR